MSPEADVPEADVRPPRDASCASAEQTLGSAASLFLSRPLSLSLSFPPSLPLPLPFPLCDIIHVGTAVLQTRGGNMQHTQDHNSDPRHGSARAARGAHGLPQAPLHFHVAERV